MVKIEEQKELKQEFIKDLAEQIVLKMIELGYTPKLEGRDYIN